MTLMQLPSCVHVHALILLFIIGMTPQDVAHSHVACLN